MSERNQSAHDTEDRGWWYPHGEDLERQFVGLCRTRLKIDAAINPAKAGDKYAPDLVVDGILSDLKVQNTPFFMSGKYGRDPRYTVVFNRKDYARYKYRYPHIDIFFWVHWMQTTSQWGDIEYLGGVYRLSFESVAAMIEAGAPEHRYQYRQGPHDMNAKSSFLLDIRCFDLLFETLAPGLACAEI